MNKVKLVRITKAEVRDIINSIPFTAFWGCTFKKNDGSTRRMNCNKSISKGLKAARIPKVIPSNYSMVNVYDVNAADGKGGYRMVNLNTITDIRTDGKLYLVQ
jgi:hypothetical protein